jgi:hypothetical protein
MKNKFFAVNTYDLLSPIGIATARLIGDTIDCTWNLGRVLRYANSIIKGIPIPVVMLAYNTFDIGTCVFKGGRELNILAKPIIVGGGEELLAFLHVFCPWYLGDTNFAFSYSLVDKTIKINREMVVLGRDEIACSCLLETTEYLREKHRIDKQYWDQANNLCSRVRDLVFPICTVSNDRQDALSEVEISELREAIKDRNVAI